jgi:RPA family protein
MTVKERCAKLHKALDTLKATRRRIKRLQTAEENWTRRVTYHTTRLQEEQQAELDAALERHMNPEVSGRKFRG